MAWLKQYKSKPRAAAKPPIKKGSKSVKTYTIHTAKGCQTFTEKDIINNALIQEKDGVTPCYKFRDNKYNFPTGWLVYSTIQDGCCVVYRRKSDNEIIILTGNQGDFICV